jgi:hypothetical protein
MARTSPPSQLGAILASRNVSTVREWSAHMAGKQRWGQHFGAAHTPVSTSRSPQG